MAAAGEGLSLRIVLLRGIAHVLDAAAVLAFAIAAAGMLVRVTVRDSAPVWAWLYYALPLIVVAAALGLAGAAWLAIGRTRLGGASIVAAVVLASLWVGGHTYANPCAPRPHDVRVLLLNASRGERGWDAVAGALPPFDLDIIGLVEAGGSGPARQKFWEDNFPGHNVYLPGGGLAILTRGDVRRIEIHPLDGISRYAEAEIDLEGRLVRVLLVDLDASPRFDRKKLIGAVFRAAEAEPDVPAIVMGDFNTPVDSRWFERARARFRHVFEEAGAGVLATWPASMPLVAIDHMWVSSDVVPTCATIESHKMSDHRVVTAHLAFPDDAAGPTLSDARL